MIESLYLVSTAHRCARRDMCYGNSVCLFVCPSVYLSATLLQPVIFTTAETSFLVPLYRVFCRNVDWITFVFGMKYELKCLYSRLHRVSK